MSGETGRDAILRFVRVRIESSWTTSTNSRLGTGVTLLGLLAMERSIAPVVTLTGLSDQSRACLERLQSHQPEQVDLFV